NCNMATAIQEVVRSQSRRHHCRQACACELLVKTRSRPLAVSGSPCAGDLWRAVHTVVSDRRTAAGKGRSRAGATAARRIARGRGFALRRQGAGCAELAGGGRGGWLGKCAMNIQQRPGRSLVLIFDKYFTSSLWIVVSAFLGRDPNERKGDVSDH